VCVCVCVVERRGDWELKAQCKCVSFLLCSLWDVTVYIVSVNILGTVHVFISGLCPCVNVAQQLFFLKRFPSRSPFCTRFRSVCL